MRAKKSVLNQSKDTAGDVPDGAVASRYATRFGIQREHILAKYWELANLDPEVTKGNITGQLKALDSLCVELGLAEAKPESNQGSGQEIYRSAWMRGQPAASA
jgi:hypothetical protein